MITYLFSCLHATSAVPEAYRELFRGNEEALQSSEGWEPGALNLAQFFGMLFRTPVVHGDVSRLLIDLSKEGDDRWSRFSKELAEPAKQKLADRYQRSFRNAIRQRIDDHLRRGEPLVHVQVHTRPWQDGRVVITSDAKTTGSDTLATAWRERLIHAGIDARCERDEIERLPSPISESEQNTAPTSIRLDVSQTFFLEGRPWKWDTARRTLADTLAKAAATCSEISAPKSPESPES